MRVRRVVILAVQIAFAAAILAFAASALADDWPAFVTTWGQISPRWWYVATSGAIVMTSYVLLIEVWRRVVRAWGSELAPGVAARIWFVSNLGRYVPGKVWQIAAMGAMSHRAGVSPAAAVGSSLLIAVINVLAGVTVVLIAGADALPWSPGVSVVVGVLAAVVALTPSVMPRMARWVGALAGRELSLPRLPYAVLVQTYVGCAIAWVLYGVAFQVLALGTLEEAGGATRYYVALFTSSYIAGYVTPWAPGGIGVREAALAGQMELYGLTTNSGALVLALVSRVWLTVLELLPGLLLLLTVPKHPVPGSDGG